MSKLWRIDDDREHETHVVRGETAGEAIQFYLDSHGQNLRVREAGVDDLNNYGIWGEDDE
jgi:hypothetical protein